MRKHLLILFIAVFTSVASFAQVTTSAITGTIKDSKGVTLPGATVVATHVPSGSVYSTTTNASGKYTIPNMRVGGPYTIKVTFVGFSPRIITDINLNLGDPAKIDIKLQDESLTLATVNVNGTKNAAISSDRNGASTHVGQRQLNNLPTVSRSLQDFTRLTPQAVASTSATDGSPLGIQFAGQNPKFNQFTIDGANATDAFGLASSGTNGGQAGINPVPLESIQDVQILLSPYDVTQGGFTGGGINAVTKSGTNDIHGSAYYIYQNENYVGKNALTGLKSTPFTNKTFGASLGGPIIKNKLFYFVNYERFENSTPLSFDPSQSGSGSNFSTATLQGISDFLKTKYGYDPGSFTNINKSIYSNSVFARIDWNINDKNKLTLRHSYVDGSDYIISRTANAMTFADGGYNFKSTTNSTVLELNSSISKNSSNVLRFTYNNVNDRRTTSPFPNVQIVQNGLTYNFGAEFSSAANALAQNNFTITDNYTIYKDNHTITIGTDNEFFNTSNLFQQAYNGAYTYSNNTSGFDNIAAFENNTSAPSAYTLNYTPTNPGDKYYAKMHTAQFGIYGQDVWSVTNQLKLTYGVRIDMPVYFNKPTENPTFNSSTAFGGIANNGIPKSKPLFAPRIGFNYDVNGDGQTQLRGGGGIFTGRAPFVWVSNAYTNNGINTVKYTTVPSALRFPTDQNAINSSLSGAYVPPSATFPATEIDVTDKNFKVPQTFRANLAIDQKLPFWGLVGTLEGIFTKNINAINYQNLNVGPQTDVVTIGSNTRPWYNFARVTNAYTDVLELTNTSQGYTYNLTAQLQKPFEKGWTGMVAYTYGAAYSVNDGTSTTAISNWRFNDNVNGLNNLDETRSSYDPGSRVIGYVSKTFRYANNKLATTIGVVYTGQSGQTFSYAYSKNISGDDVTGKTGSNNADLIYVPSQSELSDPAGYLNYKLVDLTSTSGGVTTIVRTAAQQWVDLKNFIDGQQGLSKSSGKVAARNSDRTPWENHFDLKLTQDFYVYKQHKLSISGDILNIGNLLNKDWGYSYGVVNQTLSLLTVVAQPTSNAAGAVTAKPTFTFDQTKLGIVNGTYRPYVINDYTSRWRGQLSIKYSF
jgi:hypothetical protein